MRKVCDFIEIDFEPQDAPLPRDCCRPPLGDGGRHARQDGRPERDAGERLKAHALATKPPTKERIEVWREDMSAVDQAEFEEVAGELLDDLGYARASSS